MKKLFSIILVFSLIYMFIFPVSAQETQTNIECSYTTDGYRVNITGRVLNINTPHMVTLMVGEVENLVYIDQTTSTSSGEFEFKFLVPETLPDGNYPFKITAKCLGNRGEKLSSRINAYMTYGVAHLHHIL